MPDTVVILDFGSQYTQLIARRIREMQVYCEIFPWDAAEDQVKNLHPKAFILSGGPSSVYETNAPTLPAYVLNTNLPVLGICYGMHLLTQSLGGVVASSPAREYGLAEVNVLETSPFFPASHMSVWMSHGDKTEKTPPGFSVLASSDNTPICAMADPARLLYAVQFHPEVRHTKLGKQLLENFIFKICAIKAEWTVSNIIDHAVESIRR